MICTKSRHLGKGGGESSVCKERETKMEHDTYEVVAVVVPLLLANTNLHFVISNVPGGL